MNKTIIIAYTATLLAYLILDGIWLGVIAKDSYVSAMAGLMREEYPIWPWVTFYGMYCYAITHLVIAPNMQSLSWKPVLISGAILGMAAYGAYNLTNIAIIKDWPLSITLKDWAWGVFVTSTSSVCGWVVAKQFR